MHPNIVYFQLVTGVSLLPVVFLQAQEKPTEKAHTANTPSSGYLAGFLDDVAYYDQRFTRWRPTEGVRFVGEVYTHIITAN